MLGKYFASANRNIIAQQRASMSAWNKLTAAPADPILGLNEAFKKCTAPEKVLLGMGVYRDNDNKPYILPCVRIAEHRILEKDMDHEYAGIEGIPSFVAKSQALAFGKDHSVIKENRLAGAQSISGTGSLRLGLTFFSDHYPNKDIDFMVPAETWPIHRNLAELTGYKWTPYRYFNPANKGLNFDGMLEDLKKAKDESLAMFHVCAHNPTGVDPTQKQWEEVLEVVLRKKMFCAFDSAYQGFASGDLDKDAFSLRLFAEHTNNLCLFQSFAKNFGLYGERVGAFSVVTSSTAEKDIVNSRIKQIARPIYSNPPIHGARIVDIILGDEELSKMWHGDLELMSGRIKEMRAALVNAIKANGSKHNWDHFNSQIGMFAFTGLDKDMINELREKYHIYMTMDGRISIAGLNTHNVERIAEAFHKVTDGKKF